MDDAYDDLEGPKADLLALLREDETLADTLLRVAGVACTAIPGCDSASVTLWREGQPYTITSTDDLARTIDAAQYETLEGPCLDASRYGEAYVISDMRTEKRWPTFAGVAVLRGALASLSVPLVVRGESLGAVNMYAVAAGSFEGAERQGRAFAQQASVVVANARVYDASRRLADSLEDSMRARAVVEQVKGRIMAERGITADEAARLLSENAPDGAPGGPTLEG